MIVFFLIGYLYIAIYTDASIIMALVLFFGSIFVTLAIMLLNRLVKTSKQRSLEVSQILISVIDSRAPSLHGHSLHVKNLMTVFYKHLPRSIKGDYNLISLEYAALFHDIGKLEMPIEILNKEGNLTEEEEAIMRTHPQVGVRLLRPIRSFDLIADWILYHHERVDGQGYYYKSADSIPVPSKIIAIIDAYSAITMGRVYSAPKTYEEAVEIIKSNAGIKYDEELVDIFLSIPKEEILACAPKLE
ncbi:MAG: HD domain-containing protein [Bacilli bacterium]|nr:HD domain-containing protein [Bacilli bacterium]